MQRVLIARVRTALARQTIRQQPVCALKRSGASLASLPLRLQTVSRSFQTTSAMLMSKDDENKTTTPKVATDDSDSDSDSGSDSDSDIGSDDEPEEDVEDDKHEEQEETLENVEVDPEAAAMAAQYLGVTYSPTKVKKYSAELELDDLVISGGDYWTALDAAKGYDELIDMYCDLDTPRNFPAGAQDAEAAAGSASAATSFGTGSSSAGAVQEWAIPETGKRNADMIPPIMGKYLELDEVLQALEREKAIDVYTVNLAGKSSLADYMIFTTGRSQSHMRRMADMMIASMKARKLQDEFEYIVEGRDCDDWMIADCSNIVVHFMAADTRRILNLEDHWENMVNDKHKVYGDMNEEEYMDRFGTSELMEYLEDDDFIPGESAEGESIAKGDDVDWK